jgi:hypothetical protein
MASHINGPMGPARGPPGVSNLSLFCFGRERYGGGTSVSLHKEIFLQNMKSQTGDLLTPTSVFCMEVTIDGTFAFIRCSPGQ